MKMTSAKNLIFSSVLFLSCTAANFPASADVIITGDNPVVIDGKRFPDDRNRDRNDNVMYYNGNSSRNGGDMYVIKDGKFIRSADGYYDLGNGEFIDRNSTYNGRIGGVDVKSPASGYTGNVGNVQIQNAPGFTGKVGDVQIQNSGGGYTGKVGGVEIRR